MAPELALIYAVGLLPPATFAFVQHRIAKKKLRSPSLIQLQENLSQINLYWSDSTSEIKERLSHSLAEDERSTLKGITLFGLGCTFLSWFGFFFQVLIYYSIKKLMTSPLEKDLFSSSLCQETVSPEEVKNWLKKRDLLKN